jgi:hypothetical protein
MKRTSPAARPKKPVPLSKKRIRIPQEKESKMNRFIPMALAAAVTAALILVGTTIAAPALRAISVPFKLMNRAEDLFQVLDGPKPIRNLLNCPPEEAPLCPQPEVSTPVPRSRPITPVRTFFQRRFR